MPVLNELLLKEACLTDVRALPKLFPELEVLDLSGNGIVEVAQFQQWHAMTALRELFLDGNPVCEGDGYASAAQQLCFGACSPYA